MDRAVAEEFRIGESGNHPQDPLLLRDAQPRLKSNQVPHPPTAVFLSELHHRVGFAAGAWVAQAYWLQRTKAQRVTPPLRHHFDRHAALEVGNFIEFVAMVLIGGHQRIEEFVVLLARQRAVEIRAVGISAVHRFLSVARAAEDERVVDRIARDDGGNRVIKRQCADDQPRSDGSGELVGCERPRRDHARRSNAAHLVAYDFNSRLRRDSPGNRRRKRITIDGECAAGRDP